LDSAIAIHKLLISKDSTNADYHNDLGDAYMKKEDITQAELCFKKAVRLNPYYTLAHVNLGTVYWKQNRYKDAMDELFLVRNLDGSYPRLQYQLTRLAKAAKSEFKEWVEREPDNGEAHYYYSFYLYYNDDRDEAVGELEKAIRINGREERYFFLKAVWLWNLKKYKEAIADCQKCLELNPHSWKCHNQIAFCHENMQDFSRATEYLRKAVEIDSLVIESQFALGESYAMNEEYHKSIDPLNRAIHLGHKGPWANYYLAVCYYNLGSYQLALHNIAMARNRNVNSPVKGIEAQLDGLQEIIMKKMH
jgi:tetratricopeptide (TPR) repeat protein